MAQKISPFLWFDDKAEEAANLYVSTFKNSEIASINHYKEVGPGNSGSVMTVSFRLGDREFTGLNGGPHYQFTPAISFFVHCESESELEEVWSRLSDGATVLMGLEKYPFSERFGWLKDRFGVSWQVNLSLRPQQVVPFLMFVGDVHGRAEEAISSYTSLFPDSKINSIERHGEGDMGEPGTVKRASFTLAGLDYMAMDSNAPHSFTFSPATSLFLRCESEAEIDHYWEALLDGGKPHQCGWLDDRFGVTWQVCPTALLDMLQDRDEERANRVTQALYQMIKIDLPELQRVYEGA